MKTQKIFSLSCLGVSSLFFGLLFVADIQYWVALITVGAIFLAFGLTFFNNKNLKP